MSSTSTLTRAQLQQLAKQHGVKANMKNAEIEAALLEKGVQLEKKKGLSVRDSNVMPEGQGEEEPQAKPFVSARKSVVREAVVEKDSETATSAVTMADENAKPIEEEATITTAARRTTRRSAGKQEQDEAKQELLELPPVTRRTTRRSAGKADEQKEEAFTKISSAKSTDADRESLAPEEEQVSPSEMPLTTTADESSETTKVEETPMAQEIAPLLLPDEGPSDLRHSVASSARYVSRRRSKERNSILQEIAKESELPAVDAEKIAPVTPAVTLPEVIPAALQSAEKLVGAEQHAPATPAVTHPEVVPAALQSDKKITPITTTPSEGVDSTVRSDRLSGLGSLGKPVRVKKATETEDPKNNSTLDTIEQSATVETVQQVAQEMAAPAPGPRVIQIARKIDIPQLPPTPKLEEEEPELIKSARPTRKVPASVVLPISQEVPEVEVMSKATTITSTRRTIKQPKVEVPLAPPTPAEVRAELDNFVTSSSKRGTPRAELESLRRKVEGALSALDTYHARLLEQKRLQEALQATREENKRLRAMLLMDDDQQ